MDMANGWVIARALSDLEKTKEHIKRLYKDCPDEEKMLYPSTLTNLMHDEDSEPEYPGDSVLYITYTAYTERKAYIERKEKGTPKRPNDGTQQKNIASGWFEANDDINQFASQPWYDYRERIGRVELCDPWALRSAKYLFDGLTYCQKFNLLKLDTSECVSFEGRFRGCSSVSHLLDVGRFSTVSLTDTSHMFMNCLALRTIDISGWDVTNIEKYAGMFAGCSTYVLSSEEQTSFLDKVTIPSAEKGIWRKTN